MSVIFLLDFLLINIWELSLLNYFIDIYVGWFYMSTIVGLFNAQDCLSLSFFASKCMV